MSSSSILIVIYNGFKLIHSISGMAKFLSEDDEICAVLRKIGEQEFQAALKSLKDAKLSNTPRREMESAITILRVANEREIGTEVKLTISLILAGIYRVLGEKALTTKFLSYSEKYFEEHVKPITDGANFIGTVHEGCKLSMEALLYLQSPLTYSLRKDITRKIMRKFGKGEEKPFGTSYREWKEQAEQIAEKCKHEFSQIHDLLAND